ncbi:MAG TPA: hypothetical protein VHB97_00325, partial [Polyangia bacterium]|nr:hypothetical protein [Polyangia bacterium]
GFYGIAIDGYKAPLTAGGTPTLIQNIWMATISSPHIVRYTPQRSSGTFAALGTGVFTDFTWTGAAGNGRGVGVDNRSPTSFAWLALDGSNALGQVNVDNTFMLPNGTLTLQPVVTLANAMVHSTNGGVTTLGAGVAADLDLWGVNQSNDSTTAVPTNATHFHVDAAGNVTAPTAADQVRLDDNGLTPGGVAHRAPYPYTYSDFTGFGLRNFTNPHGSYTYIWTGCGMGKTKWISVNWDAATPPGTAISMKARSTDDETMFSTATFTGSYSTSPADLRNAPPGGGSALSPNPSGFLQVEFDLTTTDKNSTPALKSYTVVYECVSGIG